MAKMDNVFQSAEQLYDHVIAKAARDAEFRANLVTDPKATISAEFDVHLPESYKIMVHESKGTALHLALPPDMKALSDELGEDELNAIAAGSHGSHG